MPLNKMDAQRISAVTVAAAPEMAEAVCALTPGCLDFADRRFKRARQTVKLISVRKQALMATSGMIQIKR